MPLPFYVITGRQERQGPVNASQYGLSLEGKAIVLFVWRRVTGRIEFEKITTKKEEVFYWVTILVSNTLGTALGDFVASTTGLGFERGALVFAGLLAIVGAAHFWLKKIPPSVLFWTAYVLTRPLGATLGDTLTKPHAEGGLEMGRIFASLTIAALMIIGILIVSGRIGSAPTRPQHDLDRFSAWLRASDS